jgi:hypothetical protein
MQIAIKTENFNLIKKSIENYCRHWRTFFILCEIVLTIFRFYDIQNYIKNMFFARFNTCRKSL